jgi:hypothetical protein
MIMFALLVLPEIKVVTPGVTVKTGARIDGKPAYCATLAPMGNIGPMELLLFGVFALVTYGGTFAFGFFVGKGMGFKQGLREPRR